MTDYSACPNCGYQNSSHRRTCKNCHAPLPGHETTALDTLDELDLARLQARILASINARLGFLVLVVVAGIVLELLRLLFG